MGWTPPTASVCQYSGVETRYEEASTPPLALVDHAVPQDRWPQASQPVKVFHDCLSTIDSPVADRLGNEIEQLHLAVRRPRNEGFDDARGLLESIRPVNHRSCS